MTKIINFFSGPGAGKSTQAAGLFYEMKRQGYKVEMPYEYPKLIAWEKNTNAIKDQLYITANQHRNIARLYGQVDYIIVDSPILFGLIYKNAYTEIPEYPAMFYSNKFDEFVLDLHMMYDSINIVLKRNEDLYQDNGRFQNLDESIRIDNDIIKLLQANSIKYHTVEVNETTIQKIIGLLK
jgi:hypothetical protein